MDCAGTRKSLPQWLDQLIAQNAGPVLSPRRILLGTVRSQTLLAIRALLRHEES